MNEDKKKDEPKDKIFNRSNALDAKTYKIRPPEPDCAVYVTITNGIVNETIRPVEIFINAKEIPYLEWSTALSRIVSGVLQSSEQFPAWLIEELEQSFDTKGGYFIRGGKTKGIVSHIGSILRTHSKELGLL